MFICVIFERIIDRVSCHHWNIFFTSWDIIIAYGHQNYALLSVYQECYAKCQVLLAILRSKDIYLFFWCCLQMKYTADLETSKLVCIRRFNRNWNSDIVKTTGQFSKFALSLRILENIGDWTYYIWLNSKQADRFLRQRKNREWMFVSNKYIIERVKVTEFPGPIQHFSEI